MMINRSTTFEHVKQKYVVASPSKKILWNKDSDSGLTGFVFESICAKVVLYDFWCNRCLFNVFQCLSNVIPCLFLNRNFHSVRAFLTIFSAIWGNQFLWQQLGPRHHFSSSSQSSCKVCIFGNAGNCSKNDKEKLNWYFVSSSTLQGWG